MKLIELSTEVPAREGWYVCQHLKGVYLLCEIRADIDGLLWALDPSPTLLAATKRLWSKDKLTIIGGLE